MVALWGAIAILSIGSVAMLLVPLSRQKREQGPARSEYDIKVYKDQLKEVDRDEKRGQLSAQRAETTRTEIQRRMLAVASEVETGQVRELSSNKLIMGATALLLPLAAVLMYLNLGTPDQKDYPLAGRTDVSARAISQQDLEMVASLAERLKKNPDDPKGWLFLGQSYMAIEQYNEAAKAYKKALALDPVNLSIALSYAESLTFSAKDEIPDEAISLFKKIRAEAPYEAKPRYYIGLNKARIGDMKGALQEWVDLMAVGEKHAPWRSMIEKQINNAAKVLKISPESVKPTARALELAKNRPAAEPPLPKGISRQDMEAAAKMTPEERDAMIRSMMERLANRMEQNPDDADGWRRLAQGYLVLGEKEKSLNALSRAEALQK